METNSKYYPSVLLAKMRFEFVYHFGSELEAVVLYYVDIGHFTGTTNRVWGKSSKRFCSNFYTAIFARHLVFATEINSNFFNDQGIRQMPLRIR